MKVKIDKSSASMIYTEDIDTSLIGKTQAIKRASHVEANADNLWEADMSPSGGPILGPFNKRSEALSAEIEWLNSNVFV